MIPLYSKSSVAVDNKCARSYYLAYEEGGNGLRTNSNGLELHLGSAIHDALAVIAQRQKDGIDVNIDEIATTAYQQVFDPLAGDLNDPDKLYIAKEQGTLVEGLIRGYFKHVWQNLMGMFTIKEIELPVIYRYMGKGMMTKGDLILEGFDGSLVYLEYKSTSSKREEWINSWKYAIQVHTTVAALRQQHNLDIDRIIVQGFYKGFPMKGQQTSIMCYGYKKTGNPPFTRDQISYEWKPGLRKAPVWEMEGGAKAWIENMPETVLSDVFPQTPPIFYNEEMATNFFVQQNYRQDDIRIAKGMLTIESDETKEYVLNRYFPQNFDSCSQSFGRPCQYLPICHGNAANNPEAFGFVPRTLDHLTVFTDLLTEEEKNAD